MKAPINVGLDSQCLSYLIDAIRSVRPPDRPTRKPEASHDSGLVLRAGRVLRHRDRQRRMCVYPWCRSARPPRTLRSDLALDALEQALYDRPVGVSERLVHHSDRGVQYLSIRYTERLAEAGIEPSVGSTCDSYDNALAESVIGHFKTEVIRRRGPWRGVEDVEFATLLWVAWFNGSRLLEPLGYVPPAEFEEAYYRRQTAPAEVAAFT